jgi:putative transposase
VLNRGNGRAEVFHKDGDYLAFLRLLADANKRLRMRVLGYCLMPNHFHLLLWPHRDGDLSRWMQWLLTAHVRRYHTHYESSGHVWQGRFKAFPIEQNEHLLTVWRYAERNALRAGLVRKAERWPWSSLNNARGIEAGLTLDDGPVGRPKDWADYVNAPQTEAELAALRRAIERGRQYGEQEWVEATAKKLGLQASLHARGRPKKGEKK